MEVAWLPDAEAELDTLPKAEQAALRNAEAKLIAMGESLTFPFQSHVAGANNLRELRPRRGDSPWRAFYRKVGDLMVIAAIGPEAKKNKRGFDAAVLAAEVRLAELEEDA